ncbi:unnamed protein product [Mytilus edulis]|uniref:Uncharacterized protein n=1 Tax=Mytilus edulis TaxID=6550 RepID=A0A8S3R2I8_MYTED|nr:unnamed protein product [Mytilus edulis]
MANFSPEICQDLGFTSTSVTDEVPVPDDTLIFSHLDASIVLHHGNAKVKKTVGLSKTPFLLEIMLSAFDEKHLQGQKSRITGSLAIVYSILMFARNAEMSAFQRMMTAICIRGRAEDMEKPLLKITGDNLDIYIKSRCVSIDKGNTDLHLFASNALTSRLSSVDMDNRTPLVPEVNRDVLKLTEAEMDNMKYSYSILVII